MQIMGSKKVSSQGVCIIVINTYIVLPIASNLVSGYQLT